MVSAIRMIANHFWQDHSWLQKLEEHEASKGREYWSEPRLKLSPHSLYSECPRATQLDLLGYHPPRDAASVRRMENGTYTHRRYADLLSELGIAEEGTLIEIDWLRGTPDFIVRAESGAEYLVELKTINSTGFKKLPRPSTNGRENLARLFQVQPSHVIQWLAYDFLLKETGRDLGKGYIVYENKDSQARTAIFVARDEELFAKTTRLAREALEYLRAGRVVDPPFPASSEICKRCYVYQACRRLEAGDLYIRGKVLEALEKLKEVSRDQPSTS